MTNISPFTHQSKQTIFQRVTSHLNIQTLQRHFPVRQIRRKLTILASAIHYCEVSRSVKVRPVQIRGKIRPKYLIHDSSVALF